MNVAVAWPPGVVTVRSTVPVPAGAIAVIWVVLPTLNVLAWLGPNATVIRPPKLVPVIVTLVPAGPLVGEIVVMVGGA